NAYELSEKDWDITMGVNLKGPFILSQEVSKVMLENKKGGKIVNIASKAGVVGINQHVAYCASKFGIVGMTKVFAIELSKFNIQVNSISPTVILTELGKKEWSGERRDNMLKTIPLGRFGYPEEVAAAAFFLVSEEASLICGENLVMDGGYTVQ
ncbi:MAG: SDR family oxidoreductase, partial [Actinomycetota bacterium]